MGLLSSSPRQRVRRVEALRAAAACGDIDTIEKRLAREPLTGETLDCGLMLELLVEEHPSIASALWDRGLGVEYHAWQPIVMELVERQHYDPFAIVGASLTATLRGGHSAVPLAVATMLLRTQRPEPAREIAERWISNPMEKRAIELALCDDPELRLRLLDEVRRVFVDEGAPYETSALLSSSEALCEEDPRHVPRILTNGGLSPLNSPLITDVPREGAGMHALYMGRVHDKHDLVWSFVVAESEVEAKRWCGALIEEPEDVEVRRLYDVEAPRAGFCFPTSMRRYIVPRNVASVGTRMCRDQTGLARRRHFCEYLSRTAAQDRAMMNRWPMRTEEEDRDWPVPPPGSLLPDHYVKAVASGLFT